MNEPFINQNDDLIIPNGAEARFQWWNEEIEDRLTLGEILDHVNAPESVKARYLNLTIEPAPVDTNKTGEFAPGELSS